MESLLGYRFSWDFGLLEVTHCVRGVSLYPDLWDRLRLRRLAMLDSLSSGTFGSRLSHMPSMSSDAWPYIVTFEGSAADGIVEDAECSHIDPSRVIVRPLCACAKQYVGTVIWFDHEHDGICYECLCTVDVDRLSEEDRGVYAALSAEWLARGCRR